MPMYNMFKYSGNDSMASGSLWNYYRDEVNDDLNESNDAVYYRRNNNKTTTSKSFEYETKTIGDTPDNNNRLDVIFADLSICLCNQ